MTDKQKKIVSVMAGAIFVLFFLFVTVFLGKPLLTLVEDPEAFRLWVESKGFLGKLVFVGMVTLQVVVALIPGEPLELCAGVAFGALEGTILCLVGILIGSGIVFALVRLLGVRLLEVFFPLEKIRSLRLLQNSKKFDRILFVVMMIPGTPKDLINYFVPLAEIRVGHWLFLCTFARIPSLVTSTFSGDALGEGRVLSAVLIFAVTGVVSAVGAWFFDRLISRHHRKKEENEEA